MGRKGAPHLRRTSGLVLPSKTTISTHARPFANTLNSITYKEGRQVPQAGDNRTGWNLRSKRMEDPPGRALRGWPPQQKGPPFHCRG